MGNCLSVLILSVLIKHFNVRKLSLIMDHENDYKLAITTEGETLDDNEHQHLITKFYQFRF